MSTATAPPGNSTAAPIDSGAIAPSDRFNIAAFGDSLMWGQGLKREETFVSLIARGLQKVTGKRVGVAVNRSRSGAQIMDRGREREAFLDTFPTLFTNRPQRERFRSGEDEGRASDLYGEIPATFPTIRWQIQAVEEVIGKAIDVVLLTGGANDIDFDEVINPQEFPGGFIEEYDGKIRTIAHDDVLDLIRKTRAKCPNAVILVFGYYTPISYSSHKSKIRAFFKHEADDSFGWFINRAFDFIDVEKLILEAQVRSVWAQGRAQHWMRLAVADANAEAAVRGPGVLFIPSAIEGGRSAFGNNPWVHEDYTDPTSDFARSERVKRCPRAEHLDKMRTVAMFLLPGLGSQQACTALHDAIAAEGPESLVALLKSVIDSHGGKSWGDMRKRLVTEINRIQRALIASFLHPNAAGASRYADTAVERYHRHLKLSAEVDRLERPGKVLAAPATGESLSDKLTRYEMRGAGSLLADIGHLDVDAVSLRIVTARSSDEHLRPDISLIVLTRSGDGQTEQREFQLNFPYRIQFFPPSFVVKKFYPHFEPGETDRFTLNTGDRLRLTDIVGIKLAMGADPVVGSPSVATTKGTVWHPRRIALEINGRKVVDRVLSDVEIKPAGSIDLQYPPKASSVGPAVVK